MSGLESGLVLDKQVPSAKCWQTLWPAFLSLALLALEAAAANEVALALFLSVSSAPRFPGFPCILPPNAWPVASNFSLCS
jgi:hypothetical protein